MKRTVWLLIGLLIFAVLLTGCKRQLDEDFLASVVSDWEILSHYSGNEDGDYLGKYNESGTTFYFNELEGMDKNSYLNVKQSHIMLATSFYEIYKSKNAPYPIMVCDVKRIDVKWHNVPQTVDDEKAVSKLLDIIRNGEGTTVGPQSFTNTKIVFDLPCELILNCHLQKDADGTFHLVYFDQRRGENLSFDVTEVFEGQLW